MPLLSFPTQTITVNHLKIRCCVAGQGEPLVLIHGLGALLEYWYKNIDDWAQHYQVIAFDLPGFGYSDKPMGSYDIDYYVYFLKEFFATLGIQSAHILAHSLGGGLALRFSEDYPERVKKLVLLDSVGFSTELELGFRLLTIPLLGAFLLRANRAQFAAILRKHVYQPEVLTDEFIDVLYKAGSDPDAQRVLLTILSSNATIFGIKRKAIAAIKKNISLIKDIPKLLIWGLQDPVLNYGKHTSSAKKLLPNMLIMSLDHCGHIPQIEHSETINAAVLEFLKC